VRARIVPGSILSGIQVISILSHLDEGLASGDSALLPGGHDEDQALLISGLGVLIPALQHLRGEQLVRYATGEPSAIIPMRDIVRERALGPLLLPLPVLLALHTPTLSANA